MSKFIEIKWNNAVYTTVKPNAEEAGAWLGEMMQRLYADFSLDRSNLVEIRGYNMLTPKKPAP
jgi:hypothetical protein